MIGYSLCWLTIRYDTVICSSLTLPPLKHLPIIPEELNYWGSSAEINEVEIINVASSLLVILNTQRLVFTFEKRIFELRSNGQAIQAIVSRLDQKAMVINIQTYAFGTKKPQQPIPFIKNYSATLYNETLKNRFVKLVSQNINKPNNIKEEALQLLATLQPGGESITHSTISATNILRVRRYFHPRLIIKNHDVSLAFGSLELSTSVGAQRKKYEFNFSGKD